MALVASAERMFVSGNYAQAKNFALRAQAKLKRGSPEWIRIQDIIDYNPAKKLR